MAIDTAAFKQTMKDASDADAVALFCWAKAAMEVRGLIEIEGVTTRKRRSDAGVPRAAAGDQLALREPAE